MVSNHKCSELVHVKRCTDIYSHVDTEMVQSMLHNTVYSECTYMLAVVIQYSPHSGTDMSQSTLTGAMGGTNR
jgi:hypothetical protein